jgi:hypothetical protein
VRSGSRESLTLVRTLKAFSSHPNRSGFSMEGTLARLGSDPVQRPEIDPLGISVYALKRTD